jgi:arsenate reductase (glutaredoxin)
MKNAKVYSYAACGTCKKALRWLEAHEVAFASVDIVSSPPSLAELRRLWKKSGLPLRKLFNTSGQSYRAGRFGERLPQMNEEEMLEALAADGKLIKRPLIDAGEVALVGFDEARYAEAFG